MKNKAAPPKEISELFNDPIWLNQALKAGNTGLWTIEINPETGVGEMMANSTMLDLLGLDSHPSPEECYNYWFSRIGKSYLPAVEAAVARLIGYEQAEVEYSWSHAKRGEIYVRCGGSRTHSTDSNIHLMGYHQDISELHSVRQSLQRSLERLEAEGRDVLTSLLTRRAFFENAEAEMRAAITKGHSVTVIMADIDFFKHVNDTYGHVEGDKVLQEFSQCLLAGLRDNDVSGRYGGEEFIVLLTRTGLLEASGVAERIRRHCASHKIKLKNATISVTASFGVALIDLPAVGSTSAAIEILNQAIIKADEALYHAKQHGRNCTWTFYKGSYLPVTNASELQNME